MGKKAQLKRQKIEESRNEKKEVRQSLYHAKNPWLRFWRRVDFWIFAVCLALIVAYPFMPFSTVPTGDKAVLHTSMGDIEITFYLEDAPNTVANFQKLTKQKFYTNMLWHRVIKGFVIQTGDPSGDGTGGPGYQFNDEINSRQFTEGAVGMANSGANTNGSQFFIVNGPAAQQSLDGKYTNFAQVTKGMDVVQKISDVPVDENDKPTEAVYLNSVELR